jgi:hypothetical protein
VDNDRSKYGVPAGATGQGRLASREEDEMIEVGAGQAERTAFLRERDPRVRAKSSTAFVAHRVAVRDEHFQVELIESGW